MEYTPPYCYQWQNPELVKTIYPFRLEKLRDFLLYYHEIDLWQSLRNTPVDQNTIIEITQEISRLNLQLTSAKQALVEAKARLKDLEKKNADFLRSRVILLLMIKKNALSATLVQHMRNLRALTDSVTWYEHYYQTHPQEPKGLIYQRRVADLQEEKEACEATQREIDQVNADTQAEFTKVGLGGLENDRQALHDQIDQLAETINTLTVQINHLPPLGKTGEVTAATSVRWKVLQYERELLAYDQERLVKEILARFDAEPNRFPRWLQYMVLHFSGMRYKSAHGSWADPLDLLKMVKVEEYENWVKAAARDEPQKIDAECAQVIQALEQQKGQTNDPRQLERIQWQIVALNDRFNRQTALIKYRTNQVDLEINTMKNELGLDKAQDQAMEQLKTRQDAFPPWMWKEIVSRTELRLDVDKPGWEDLTPEETKERWDWKNRYWREIMVAWEGKDITAWRTEHALTLELVVTRAVCNEIAEHIQHLRGRTPAGGLTARPLWYLIEQKAAKKKPPQPPTTDLPYLKPPGQQTKDDFKPGASILFLGWVYQMPSAWQIATPLEGITTLPPRDAWSPYPWSYRQEGSSYVREASVSTRRQPKTGRKGKARPGDSQSLKNWLRWTHEATVVGVAEMAGGVQYVLTFETGQIGLRLRTLRELLNNPYVYVGYMPAAPLEPENLPEMLARDTLLPAEAAATSGDVSFAVPEVEIAIPTPEVETGLQAWRSLTRRERQVVTLICAGKSVPEIAERLGIERSTVRKHLQNAMRKFGVHSRLELRQAVAEDKPVE